MFMRKFIKCNTVLLVRPEQIALASPHATFSSGTPSHSIPPYAVGGSVQLLVFTLSPRPQDTEHDDHSAHIDQAPLTSNQISYTMIVNSITMYVNTKSISAILNRNKKF